MGFPSGVFQSDRSGKLQVTFSGRPTAYGSIDPGFNYSGGGLHTDASPDCVFVCTAGSATTRIDFRSPTNVIELDYVAGTSVAVAMSYSARRHSGTSHCGITHLRIRCILMKR
jgi:hypothetical protein